jgi:hypothetical protein
MLSRAEPGILLALLRFVIPPETGSFSNKRWSKCTCRLLCLAHHAGLPDIASYSMSDLARQLNVSRSLMSHYSVQITDELSQSQSRGGRSIEAREHSRQAAIRSHTSGDRKPTEGPRMRERRLAAEAKALAMTQKPV